MIIKTPDRGIRRPEFAKSNPWFKAGRNKPLPDGFYDSSNEGVFGHIDGGLKRPKVVD